MHNVLDMRRPFRSRCFGTCHFCIKTSPHGYKLHAIVRKLQELKLRYSVISYLSYLSYHSFSILDDLPKSDISYFLSITVPSAVRIRRPPSASALYRVPWDALHQAVSTRRLIPFAQSSLFKNIPSSIVFLVFKHFYLSLFWLDNDVSQTSKRHLQKFFNMPLRNDFVREYPYSNLNTRNLDCISFFYSQQWPTFAHTVHIFQLTTLFSLGI